MFKMVVIHWDDSFQLEFRERSRQRNWKAMKELIEPRRNAAAVAGDDTAADQIQTIVFQSTGALYGVGHHITIAVTGIDHSRRSFEMRVEADRLDRLALLPR